MSPARAAPNPQQLLISGLQGTSRNSGPIFARAILKATRTKLRPACFIFWSTPGHSPLKPHSMKPPAGPCLQEFFTVKPALAPCSVYPRLPEAWGEGCCKKGKAPEPSPGRPGSKPTGSTAPRLLAGASLLAGTQGFFQGSPGTTALLAWSMAPQKNKLLPTSCSSFIKVGCRGGGPKLQQELE